MDERDPHSKPNPGPSSKPFHSASYQAIQTLFRAFPLILRAAALPFALAVASVVVARLLGAPERYLFDGLHGLMVLAYVTAVARIAAGTQPGRTVFGLAVPHPVWLGLKPTAQLAGEAVLLMLPTAFVLFLLAINIGPFFMMVESLVLDVVGHILPEFILNTLLGLVIGSGYSRFQAEQG